MAGLVPAISLRRALCFPKRDARVKPAHDAECVAHAVRNCARLRASIFTCQTAKVLVPAFALAGRVQFVSPSPKRGSGAPEALGQSMRCILERCTALPLSGSARLAALHCGVLRPRIPTLAGFRPVSWSPGPGVSAGRGIPSSLPRYSRAKLWRGRRIRSRIGIASRCALTGRTWFVYGGAESDASENARFCANHE